MAKLSHLVVVACMLMLPVASIASAARLCGDQHGSWSVTSAPPFEHDPDLVDIAVGGRTVPRLLATNGAEVAASFDRGCNWEKSFDVAHVPALASPLRSGALIKAVESSGDTNYLLIEQNDGGVTRVRVLASTDAKTWRAAETGLPLAATPRLLRVAPGDGRVVYAIVELRARGDVLFASDDGGATWQARGPVPGSAVLDLDVNPTQPGELWLGADDGLYVSRDSGVTFGALDEFVGHATGPIDVFQRDGPSRLVAFHPDRGFGQMSEDGGRAWARVDQPGWPDSIASGDSAQAIALAAGKSVYGYSPALFGWIDLRAPVDGIRNLHRVPGDHSAIVGHSTRRIAIYERRLDVSIRVPRDVVEIPDLSLLQGTRPVGRRAQLLPVSSTVRLEVGDTRSVKYNLALPESLTPVDLVFVVDTSSSMTQFIDQAARAIAAIHDGLVSSGASVQFGLIDYRSYPTDLPPRSDTPNYVYRRILDAGASPVEMEEAIGDLVADGGGVYDAQLEALWQLATGEGKDVWPPGPSSRDVPPGWQANFRKKALRIVVHVGDEPFGHENAASDSDGVTESTQDRAARPDIPEFDAVARQLRDRSIKHVGLSLYEAGTQDLKRMAEATETFAPRTGADCDGNGTVDIVAGDPLVCEVRPDQVNASNMSPAILGLVAALRSTAHVGLEVRGRADVVQSITPPQYRVVLAARRSLPFEIKYRCPRTLAGAEARVKLVASGLPGAQPVARTKIKCGEVRRGTKRHPITPVFGNAPAVPPSLLLRPPPPPGGPPPNATNMQGQPQPNGGFAAQEQEQEQPQLALAYQVNAETERGSNEEYAFSSLRRPEPAPVLPLAGAAVLMTLAYGVATRLRDQAQFAGRARSGTRHRR